MGEQPESLAGHFTPLLSIYVSILEVRHMHNLTTTYIISYACVPIHAHFVKGPVHKEGIESGFHVHAYIPA